MNYEACRAWITTTTLFFFFKKVEATLIAMKCLIRCHVWWSTISSEFICSTKLVLDPYVDGHAVLTYANFQRRQFLKAVPRRWLLILKAVSFIFDWRIEHRFDFFLLGRREVLKVFAIHISVINYLISYYTFQVILRSFFFLVMDESYYVSPNLF